MIVENWPSFKASGRALASDYVINFYQDLNHTIPLNASWQGDEVSVQSAYVDNYDNAFAITATNGNDTQIIPAYSAGHLDLRGFDYLVLSSPGVCYLKFTLSTARAQPGFVARGNTPNAGLDPLIGKVNALYHFEGQNGARIASDFSPAGFGDLNFTLPSAISTRYGVFGNTSGVFLFNGTISAQSDGTAEMQSRFTVEFWIAVDTLNANHNLVTICGDAITLNNGGGGTFSVAGFGTTTLGLATLNKSALYGQFYHVVFQVDNGLALVGANGIAGAVAVAHAGYVNTGSIIFNSTASANVGPGAEGFYLDEFRFTNGLRYDLTKATYTIPTESFLNN